MTSAFIASSPMTTSFAPRATRRVDATHPPVRHARRRAVAPPRAQQQQQGGGRETDWTANDWNTEGSGVVQAGMQTIEFIIRPGGMVEETVTGVKGGVCEKLTESIEQALGKVVHTEKTEEFFEKPIERVTDNVVDATRQNKWTGGENYPTW